MGHPTVQPSRGNFQAHHRPTVQPQKATFKDMKIIQMLIFFSAMSMCIAKEDTVSTAHSNLDEFLASETTTADQNTELLDVGSKAKEDWRRTVTHCDRPACTAYVWNSPATTLFHSVAFHFSAPGNRPHTCGARIQWKQSRSGGWLSLEAACRFVAAEFPRRCGFCGGGYTLSEAYPQDSDSTSRARPPDASPVPTATNQTTKKVVVALALGPERVRQGSVKP